MNLRITGTKEEVKELVELLPVILNVKNVSKEYPNRGSKDVRVYVAGCVEGSTLTQAFKAYAKFKSEYDKVAMLLVAASEVGNIAQINASTKATAFKNLISHILYGDFAKGIQETIQKSYVKNNDPEESEDPNNAS